MLIRHHEYDVVVTAVASVGSAVLADGREGFIDQAKHPSWWSDTPRAAAGDRMRAVVLDATRTPPRLSALPSDIRIARSLRHTEPLERLCPPGVRVVPWGYVEGAGHVLYWLVRPGVEPEEWTVILNEGRGPLWEATPVSCSRFVLDVVAGTSSSYYFADVDEMVDPEDRNRFRSHAQILDRTS
ncbi:hypothetical protein [Streptomyces sp. WAC01280]|uniref:hypothetical protein n=1 Tax=Streptomyces sp. WAC01280 TaxID=2487424 RepID=UPI00163D2474|nr:hypothetical protein [Streptomyces sp. WAC01280]